MHLVDCPELLGTIEILGDNYIENNEYMLAEAIYQRVLNYREKNYGLTNADTLNVVNKISKIYLHLNQLDNASKLSEHALGACVEVLGLDDPITQTCVTILANVKYSNGYKEEAEKMYLLAYECQQRTLGG